MSGATTLSLPIATEQPCCGNVRSELPAHRPTGRPMDTTTRLADEMDRRRVELGFEWEDICRIAEVSSTFLRKFRRGATGARPLTKARIEDALQWERGSIDAVQAGGAPTPATTPHKPTLGELLVARGLAKPGDLTPVEDITDPGIAEVLALDDLTDDEKNTFLLGYAEQRRRIFAEYLPNSKKPRR